MHKKPFRAAIALFLPIFFGYSPLVLADEIPPENLQSTLTFRYELQSFSLPLAKNPEFLLHTASPNPDQETCEWPSKSDLAVEEIPLDSVEFDEARLRDFFSEYIVPKVDREPQSVRIFREENGDIAFEGAGIKGVRVDLDRLVELTKMTLESGVFDISIPVTETPPEILVEDEELKKMGIIDLLAVGESDFSGSSWDRMHNVETGKNRFNGLLIPQGEIFSFNKNLGAVNSATGYVPELVITGQKLSREYGGGLCQVSSTTFRAALLAGLPITERYNHSFAVHYYEPWGTDATIYLGGKDFKFQNDTPGAILIQTTMDRPNRILQFHFYGTRDERKTKLFGPFLSNHVSPLPSRVEVSEKLAPGEKLSLSNAVAGFDAEWTRFVLPSKEFTPSQNIYRFFSRYEPRANWTLIGGEKPAESPPSL